jgi:pantothenate kinase
MKLSEDADANIFSFGLKATLHTSEVWADKFHIRVSVEFILIEGNILLLRKEELSDGVEFIFLSTISDGSLKKNVERAINRQIENRICLVWYLVIHSTFYL